MNSEIQQCTQALACNTQAIETSTAYLNKFKDFPKVAIGTCVFLFIQLLLLSLIILFGFWHLGKD